MKISRQFLLLRIFLAVSEFMLQCPIGSVIFSYNAIIAAANEPHAAK